MKWWIVLESMYLFKKINISVRFIFEKEILNSRKYSIGESCSKVFSYMAVWNWCWWSGLKNVLGHMCTICALNQSVGKMSGNLILNLILLRWKATDYF